MGAKRIGRWLVVTAGLAVAASILGGIAGVVLVREIDTSLGRSLELTSDALTAVDDSLDVAGEVLTVLDDGLANTEVAGEDLVNALDTGAGLLQQTADVTAEEIAPGLVSVEDAMSGLVSVAGTVDGALSALSSLPIGVTYDPENGFGEALRVLQTNLAGTGAELDELAGLVEASSGQLTQVRDSTEVIVGDLTALGTTVSEARQLVADYTRTTDRTRRLIAQTRDELAVRTGVATAMVVALALAVALGQLVPVWIGWQCLRHGERIDRVLAAVERDGTGPADGHE